jgi:methylase of polypeptide subunit release factors
LKINKEEGALNVIDVGCGSGIFSIIFLSENNFHINELAMIDIEENCLLSSLQNILYYRKYFLINKLTIIKSDLFKDLDSCYFKYFDIVLANMPQTPSKVPIQSSIIYNV